MRCRAKEQLPDELLAVAGIEVMLTERPLTIRIPDVIVVRAPDQDADPARFTASDVRVVVEILSDGTRKVDRILTFAEYADAGIPRYWILDVDGPVTLQVYVLVDGTYELAGEHTGTAVLDVGGPSVTLDLDALVR